MIGTVGPGSLLAALNVKYRDFRYVIPFMIQMLFFVTPVLFPISMLPYPWLKYFVAASPVYAPIELFRLPLPGSNLDPELVMISAGSGLVFLALGMIYFRRTEDFFADFA
jgi:lipopolysaccharide transport system permease protein